jgi:predicted CXXCH cytochrome family protein
MKKLLLLTLCLTLGTLLAATSAMAFTGLWVPGSGINHTVHDLTDPGNAQYAANPTDAVGGRICIYCHTPHNAIRLSDTNGGQPGTNGQASDWFTYLPLWNHQLTTNAGAYAGYYNGPGAPDAAASPHGSQAILLGALSVAGSLQPGSTSLLCLSCHDGSISVNAYGTGPNGGQVAPDGSYSSGGITLTGTAYAIGQSGNLQNHHPIGFDYDAVQSMDTEIRASSTDMSDYNGNIMTIADHLYGPSGLVGSCNSGLCMECGTCHSVHNKSNTGERLLWRSDVNSQLCLTCHDKGVYTEPDGDPTVVNQPRP